MKRKTFAIVVTVVCILFSAYAYAEVGHPENTSIVGIVFFDTVCLNNDGGVGDITECDGSFEDEGSVALDGGTKKWVGVGSPSSGINGCGVDGINPVSSATCTYALGDPIAYCTNDGYVLVQTTQSDHFWAIKADATCDDIASPETTGLVPCLLSDAFHPVTGCASVSPPVVTVKDGYLQPDTGKAPPDAHCDDDTHLGRMVVDSVAGLIYICTQTGWIAK